MRLQGKRCLIVGGAGGIGLAAARRFLEEGAHLFIGDLNPESGAAALQTLQPPGSVHFFACDATDPIQVEHLFQQVQSTLGGLDVLFHVAGISGRRFGDGPLHQCTDEGWDRTLRTNLTGVFHTNRAALRRFLEQGQGGVILNMTSVLAEHPSPHFFDTCAYSASKGGIVSLTRLAAASYGPHGIRVNALAPGLIDTPMASRAVTDPAIQAFLETKQPLRKGPGGAEDCAEAAVFLCSDAARFITGVILPVDGGWGVSDGQYDERK